jgi:hypothetical protein
LVVNHLCAGDLLDVPAEKPSILVGEQAEGSFRVVDKKISLQPPA